jgi:non-specific protein-tyrosine kinase
MREMSASVLGRILYRNLAFIAPFCFIGILLGNYVSASTTPMFRSSSDLFISTPASAVDLGLLATGSTFSQERVKSYTQIINAPATLQPVIDRLQLDITPEALATRITASAPPDTVVIRITVVDSNPIRAASIANEVSMQFALTAESIELPQANSASPVKVSVARPAIAEFGPISPKKNTNRLLGFVSMFLLAYMFFVSRYLLDLTVKNVTDIGGYSLLAAIGFDPMADKTPLLSDVGSYDARMEAFRTFRTNLLNAIGNTKNAVVAVTSGVAEEGKTTASINLGISFSKQGVKTLLIEADLRRPRMMRYFVNLPNQELQDLLGLSHLLSAKSDAEMKKQVKQAISPIAENLDCIFAGEIVDNPTELLGGDRIHQLFSSLRSSYDLIIVDCPPVLPVTDASVICKIVDGVVVIVYGGKTRIKSFDATIDVLLSVKSKIYGIVINKIPNSRESADYGYKSGYSKYYKRTYGYGLRKRGYTPYGPYGPLESSPYSQKADKKFPEAVESTEVKASKIEEFIGQTRKADRSSTKQISTSNVYSDVDALMEQFWNNMDQDPVSRKKAVPGKKVAKKAVPGKKVAKKAVPGKKVAKKAANRNRVKRP